MLMELLSIWNYLRFSFYLLWNFNCMGLSSSFTTHAVNQQIPSNLLKQGIQNCLKISSVTKSLTKIKIFSLSLELTKTVALLIWLLQSNGRTVLFFLCNRQLIAQWFQKFMQLNFICESSMSPHQLCADIINSLKLQC